MSFGFVSLSASLIAYCLFSFSLILSLSLSLSISLHFSSSRFLPFSFTPHFQQRTAAATAAAPLSQFSTIAMYTMHTILYTIFLTTISIQLRLPPVQKAFANVYLNTLCAPANLKGICFSSLATVYFHINTILNTV